MRRKFTLVELLVVISIIAMLLCLLLPSLRRARDAARGIQCVSNLRNVGVAMAGYTTDYDGYFPPSYYGTTGWSDWKMSWMQLLGPYLGMKLGEGQAGWELIPVNSVLACPSIKQYEGSGVFAAYGYNHLALGTYGSYTSYGYTRDGAARTSRIGAPAQQLQHADSWYDASALWSRSDARWIIDDQNRVCYRHSQAANAVYVDGHVKAEKQDWLWIGHPVTYPWNIMLLNKPFAAYPGRVDWGTQFGYWPY